MIVTDDQLAADAERLGEVAEDLFAIALRLQLRYPASRVLASTVDRFLQAVLESGASLPRAA